MEVHRNRTLETNGRRHLPLPTGPYQNVGFRDIMIGFSRRTGFLVRLYYPAADQSRDIRSQSLYWSNWLPHENYRQGYISLTGVKWSLFQKAIRWLAGDDCFIPAIPKAKPLSQRMIPIVFSHGNCSCRTTYTSLALEFASHGFIVAAVEHRDGTACCTFYAKETRMPLSSSTMNVNTPDGPLQYEEEEEEGFDEIDDPNYVPPKALSNSAILPHIATEWIGHLPIKGGRYTLRNRQINRRVKECIRTLDLLEALEAGYDVQNLLDSLLDPSEFEGLIDISKAIIMGHSYGGATAIMTCSAELRFRLGICLDAWMYPIYKENFDLVTQPICFINSEKFQTDENLRAIKRVLETNPYSCTDSGNQSHSHTNGNGNSKTVDDALTNTVDEGSTLPDTSENKQVSKGCTAGDEQADELDSRSLQNRVATIKGTVHYNQTDIPFVMPWLIKAFYGGNSRRNPFTALDLTAALAMEFISKQLKLDILSIEKKVFLDKQRKKIKLGIKDKL